MYSACAVTPVISVTVIVHVPYLLTCLHWLAIREPRVSFKVAVSCVWKCIGVTAPVRITREDSTSR